MINSYYEISKEEEMQVNLEIGKVAFEMDKFENDHRNDINAFENKYKHLEYDHDTFITKTLVENSTKAVKDEEENRLQREEIFMENKSTLKKDIKEHAGFNRDDIEKTKEKHDKRYKQTFDDLERRLNENKKK
jgi:hypothetical protein